MADERGTELSPSRATAWGELSDREAMKLIAEDVAERAAFRTCAIEVLRTDGMLEFAAVHGTTRVSWLLGEGSPMDAKEAVFTCGATFGSLTFVAAEWLTGRALEVVDEYGYLPDLPDLPGAGAGAGEPDAWRARDLLVARLLDDAGRLCAVLYLDEPRTGRRLQPAELFALSDTLQLAFRAVVTTVEREALAQQVRIAQAARTMIRAASARLELRELLDMATQELREGFRAVKLEIHVLDDGQYPDDWAQIGTGFHDAVEQAMQRAWRHERVVIVEPGQILGDPELDEEFRDEFSRHLLDLGLGALVLVPIGVAGHLLGALAIHRGSDSGRWTDSESAAAFDVGQDLGSAMLKARAFQSEHQLNTELRRLDEYRQELISTVSHELKNPIGAVLGRLEMLDSEPGLSATGRASLDAIERAAARLEALADDLLTLSRLGATGSVRSALPIDLVAVLLEAIESTEVLIERHGVELKVDDFVGPMVVLGDADDLLRAVSNVISNAVKYSESGGVVQLSLEQTPQGVLLACSDDGLGISEADQARLFTEFFRSTNSDALSRPGTGLGLAIVRRIVERHRGRIEVESVLGAGTTFRIWLPERH